MDIYTKRVLRRHVEAGYARAAADPGLRPFRAHLSAVRDTLRAQKRMAQWSKPYPPFTAAYWAGVYSAMAEAVATTERVRARLRG